MPFSIKNTTLSALIDHTFASVLKLRLCTLAATSFQINNQMLLILVLPYPGLNHTGPVLDPGDSPGTNIRVDCDVEGA